MIFFPSSTVFLLPNLTFSKNYFMNTQCQTDWIKIRPKLHYVGPALDSNCLQKYKHTTAAFDQGVYYFIKTRKIFGTLLITCDPLIYRVNYPILLLL